MDNQYSELQPEAIDFFMREALKEAERAVEDDEVPVGCVFVRKINNAFSIIQRSHNLTNKFKNASKHCEINCFTQMEKRMSSQEIEECILFVTVEPCVMCTHALNLMKIKMVYFGQFNDKFGGCGSLRKDNIFEIQGGVLQKQSLQILKNFYERGNQRIPEQMRNKSRKKVKKD